MLTDIMSIILPYIISFEQSGFVKGMSITENVLLAYEMIQKLDTKIRGNNVVLKLDMEKAYDRLSWLFILHTLRHFGFDERLIDMVWILLSNCWYSLIING